ncbi:MAG: Flp/Fap pilin component [Hyphomicrobiales bacterium]|nr:Flp/Fap pilin component [Hyphomicrobiales bacterium]
MKLILRFVSDDSGATAIEYVLIGAFASILIIGGLTSMGTKVSENYINKILPAFD